MGLCFWYVNRFVSFRIFDQSNIDRRNLLFLHFYYKGWWSNPSAISRRFSLYESFLLPYLSLLLSDIFRTRAASIHSFEYFVHQRPPPPSRGYGRLGRKVRLGKCWSHQCPLSQVSTRWGLLCANSNSIGRWTHDDLLQVLPVFFSVEWIRKGTMTIESYQYR